MPPASFSVHLLLMVAAAASALSGQSKTYQVFILAGQSNMEGKVQNELLEIQATDPATSGRFAHLRSDGHWIEREDVFVDFLGKRGGLSIGYGSRDRTGVELEFGTILGDHFDEPVLLIKTAWGGRSLDGDFRPPSAGLPAEAKLQQLVDKARKQVEQRNKKNNRSDPLPKRDDIVAGYGRDYRKMLARVETTLAKAAEHFPQLAGLQPVVRGFVWHQGWNDQYEGREQRYEANLRHFVSDVRRDLKTPELPFVIAVMGQNGSKLAKGPMHTIQQAQLAVGNDDSLAPIAAVRTDDLVDLAAEELFPRWRDELDRWKRTGSDRPYHYLGSAIWHLRIGRQLGLAMLAMLEGTPASSWPQGSGPAGNWRASGALPPLRFSAQTGRGILWRQPLPETGQGGIAVHGDRLFVTTMAPLPEVEPLSAAERRQFAHAIEKRDVVGKDIDAHCLDARTGAILWSRRIAGYVPSIYSYPFSDATSASPVTDGQHVWFTNAGGRVCCFTIDGGPVWEHSYTPAYEGPFNKQFEPFLVHDGDRKVFVHMQPVVSSGMPPTRFHHLMGLDALSGKVLWESEHTLTQYNAPTLLHHRGETCVLHARGGPHQVPERPVGISLTFATGPRAGQAAWHYQDPRGNHEGSLQTMASDDAHVYWLLKQPHNVLVVLDRNSGKQLREISLTKGVTRSSRNPETGAWQRETDIDLDKGVFPARYSMIATNGHLFFQCYATAWGKPTIGPAYSFARVQPGSATIEPQVEYVEVPTSIGRGDNGETTYTWRTAQSARAINSHGDEVTGDKRSRWDGWDWVFNGSPTAVDHRIYFTLQSGIVYVFDAASPQFDRHSLLAMGDLGEAGATWTGNSVSYADGRLFHRTARELLCIGDR